MDRDEIVRALVAVGERLDQQGLKGEMYVVGGAAMALAYASRRSTRDVDAVFEPKLAIYQAASEVAEELGLPIGWLNDAVKGFLGGEDPHAAPVLDVPGLRCLVASPRMLLALKGLSTSEEVLDIVTHIFGDRLDPAAQFFVEELFLPKPKGPAS